MVDVLWCKDASDKKLIIEWDHGIMMLERVVYQWDQRKLQPLHLITLILISVTFPPPSSACYPMSRARTISIAFLASL
jgi:hypothetical protein